MSPSLIVSCCDFAGAVRDDSPGTASICLVCDRESESSSGWVAQSPPSLDHCSENGEQRGGGGGVPSFRDDLYELPEGLLCRLSSCYSIVCLVVGIKADEVVVWLPFPTHSHVILLYPASRLFHIGANATEDPLCHSKWSREFPHVIKGCRRSEACSEVVFHALGFDVRTRVLGRQFVGIL